LEAAFDQLEGVISVVSGYTGGHVANPAYAKVCTGTTGHAEAIQITFNPGIISYRELLEVFFAIHDPTTLNRQGADTGTQYRSAVFYHTPEQKVEAERIIKELEALGVWDQPIVTEVKPFNAFYPAEEYHQQYYRKRACCHCYIRNSQKWKCRHKSPRWQEVASGVWKQPSTSLKV
jgi:peptide-methionine (S)-S-oxide reductase